MNIQSLVSTAAIISCVACADGASESSATTEPTGEQSPHVAQETQPPPAASSPAAASALPTRAPVEPIATTGASTPPSEVPALPTAPVTADVPGVMAPVPGGPPPATTVDGDPPPATTVDPAVPTGSTASASSSSDPPADSDTMAPTPAPVAPSPPRSSEGFQLLWEDPFDTLDSTRWAAQTHSWDGNLAQFTPDNVAVVDGRLQISLTPSGDEAKPYDGVEYRSVDAFTYGKVEASMRFAKGSGVVSSLVLIFTPWPPDDWNELDIECLGNTTGEVQFNHMVNIPPADPVSGHLQFPEKIDLGFDPTADFHTYTIEWLPDAVRFLVDGVVVHEPTEEVSRLVLPQNILLTIWASDSASWAGRIDDTTAPTFAEVDWLRVYSYTAP